jgi:cation diffusion facilitator family transporter
MHAEAIQAHQEKRWVALTSLWAAVGITAFKVIVGLTTGSLGILAEAAHSALDLAAAAMTFFAIRVSARPADREHLYGHGKVENVSALFETLLLLATCVWIFYEAAHRLGEHADAKVQVNAWSFAVMITSIIVDWSRSRALSRAAIKHNSQALEADALHFSTDIWSSLAVIVGLICVKLGEWYPSLAFLHVADSVAAIGVAVIVVWVSVKLGWRTIRSLLDTVPAGMEQRITEAVTGLPGVAGCHQVRARMAGPQVFVDVHIEVDGTQTLKRAHDLTEDVERVIQNLHPDADVTVHAEPAASPPPAPGDPAGKSEPF